MSVAPFRETKYCNAVRECIGQLGHASNSVIHKWVTAEYPDISATTIHRVTTRLYKRGAISIAPPDKNGSVRYDANIRPHDHFICEKCYRIKDIDIYDDIKPNIESCLGVTLSNARITITASCDTCKGSKNR